MNHLRLARAVLCLDCETVFEIAERCPRCASGALAILSRWLSPAALAERVAAR